MKISKKIYNPITGKYVSYADTAVMALITRKTPDLIDLWSRRCPDMPFDEFLLNAKSDTPIKGVKEKFIAKRYSGVVSTLIDLWQSEKENFSTFDMYMEHLYTRVMSTPKHK